MSWLKVLILWLAVLHTAAAFDVVNPFSWKAVEDAEKQATAAIVSLYADSVRLQQRVKEHVFAPEVADTPPPSECKPSPGPVIYHRATGSAKLLLIIVLAVPAAFLFGWVCGTRQAQSRQAIQQARAADQQAEALADQQTDVAAVSLKATPQPLLPDSTSLPAGAPSHVPYSDSHTQSLHKGQATAPSAAVTALSSVESDSDAASGDVLSPSHQASVEDVPDTASSWGSASEPDDQPVLKQQHQHAQQQLQHAAAPPEVASCSHDHQAPSSDQHVDTHLQYTSRLHQQPQPSSSSASQAVATQLNHSMVSTGVPHNVMQSQIARQHTDERGLFNNAARMVYILAQELGLNPEQLSEEKRWELMIPAMNAVSLQLNHRNNQEHHRLREIANNQGAEHNTILREGQSDTKLWRQAKEEQKQLQQFFNRLADCLMCGLVLMLGGMLYWGVSLGYLEGRLSECKGRRAGVLASFWSPWQAVESLQTLWCYGAATVDLTGSVMLMLAVPWFVKKHGLLNDSMTQPMTGLILGLGVACGLIGQFSVGRVGGDNIAWLSMYWAWIAMHVLSIWFVHGLYRSLNSEASGGVFQQLIACMKMPVYYSFMGIIMPMAVAACPFWRLMLLI